MARVYAGQSAQDRSDTRRRQFVDAAIAVMGTRGVANATVRAICDEAGLSTRFFYDSFDSLDALAVAAYDECVADAFTTIDARTGREAGGPLERSRAAVVAIFDYTQTYPERARLVFIESSGCEPLAPKRRATMQLFASAIAAHAKISYGVDESGPVVRAAADFVAGGLVELMIGWLDGEPVQREAVIDHCAKMIVAAADATIR